MERPLPPGFGVEISGKMYKTDDHDRESEYGLKIRELMAMPPGIMSSIKIKRFFTKNEGKDLSKRKDI